MLIDFLKQRYTQAEKFTNKEFIDMAKKAIKDYDAQEDWIDSNIDLTSDAINKRYEFIIPLIFTNTESIKASSFEKIPEVIFNGRGEDDDDKKRKVEGAYKYIADIVDLETFMFDTYHWFVLLGFCSGHASFKSEYTTVPVIDETTGKPQLDETGQPVNRNVYTYNDPILDAGDPLKEFYSPDSEFSINAEKIPFLFRKKSVTPSEIKRTYSVDIKPDAIIDVGDKEDKNVTDNKRCTLYFYYGDICEEVSKEVDENKKPLFPNWKEGKEYYIIYAGDKILFTEEIEGKSCKVGRWYGHPNKFFGYGTGKIGRQFQKEKSIRRGQMIRLADVAAFPKLVVNNDGKTKLDPSTMLDPRENLMVLYEGETKPEYLQPGNLAPIVTANSEMADQDAQQAFGIMDISQGSQNSSTVKTATGQTIFADASQRRVAFAKKRYLKFIKGIIILLLTLARDNWDEDKLISVTDDNGDSTNIPISAEDLKDIDFEKDIDVQFETPSVNKDIIRQQMISLYDKFKDDPLVNREELVKDLLRTGFDIKNPNKYIKKPSVAPGTVLTDQNGQQITVGESGELMTAEDMASMGNPSNEQAIKNQPQLQ